MSQLCPGSLLPGLFPLLEAQHRFTGNSETRDLRDRRRCFSSRPCLGIRLTSNVRELKDWGRAGAAGRGGR